MGSVWIAEEDSQEIKYINQSKIYNMKKYSFSFTGRQSGAIGITYAIKDTYKANTIGEAMYMLHTDYEHIQGLQVTENSKRISIEVVKLTACDTSKCYPNRETDPETGAYKYTRSDTSKG